MHGIADGLLFYCTAAADAKQIVGHADMPAAGAQIDHQAFGKDRFTGAAEGVCGGKIREGLWEKVKIDQLLPGAFRGETPESPPVSVFILCISHDAEMLTVAGAFP